MVHPVFSLYIGDSPGGVFCKLLIVLRLDAFSCIVVSKAERFRCRWLFGIAWILSFGFAQGQALPLVVRMTGSFWVSSYTETRKPAILAGFFSLFRL